MDEMAQLTQKLEYLFLKNIVTGFRDKTLELMDGKRYATEFLKIEPFASIDDAKLKIQNYVKQFGRFAEMQEYMDAYHEETKTDALIDKIQQYMKNNNVDAALKIAQST